ncbi:MAG: chromate efflux transporter [Pseudomonadota bacterium]
MDGAQVDDMTLGDLMRLFARIGCLSFGGPAAQIALMHKELVEDAKLMSEAEFLKALSFCMLLPGPEAMQLATYAGWTLRGAVGGLIAGLLFVVPGAIVITCLAGLYVSFGDVPLVQAAFVGIKAAVIIIVAQAILRLLKNALNRADHRLIAVLAFVALFLFNLPFPVVIGVAALYGALACRDRIEGPTNSLPWSKAVPPVLIGLPVWVLPVAVAWLFGAHFLTEIGLFFSWLAVVTFGGAYAVLAYMTQIVVTEFGWLSTPQMIDALGLAETTPGPLILVTQFVSILAGYGESGWGMAGLAGLMTLWVTFVPCFIWIFAGAPFIDWLDQMPRIRAALAAVTAAVVGVIASLSVWFAAHVWFADLSISDAGPLRILTPDWTSLDLRAVALTALSAVLMLGLNWPLGRALVVLAGAGALIGLV